MVGWLVRGGEGRGGEEEKERGGGRRLLGYLASGAGG